MTKPLGKTWSDERMQRLIGNLLRWGVLLSAAVVLCGGAVYLSRYGSTRPDYAVFRGEPAELHTPAGIVNGVFHGSSRIWIQLGLLILIATPIARVAFSIFGFLLEGDLLYVGVTLLVFGVLVFSLFASH
ncbi:MAG TPA: DUF1634 domain-containing protein [Patescibacteria group bacterium]|nr:DUF1634 domain-containing protein [Patescibacteria group bacterium]